MKYLSVFIILLVSILKFSTPTYASAPIKFRADIWCPYNCDPKSDMPGFVVELLQQAFGKESVEYKNLSWARAIEETRQGAYDAIIGAYKEDAPDFIFPAISQGPAVDCIYGLPRKDDWKYQNAGSLEGKKIGIIKDYAYGDGISEMVAAPKTAGIFQAVSGEDASIQNYKKSLANRIDGLIENESVFSWALKQNKELASLKNLGCLKKKEIFVAFSPKNPESAARAQKLIETQKKLQSSGEWKKILAKYGLK